MPIRTPGKMLLAVSCVSLAMSGLSGCGGGGGRDTINVISREEGSGTRAAFVELTGVLTQDAANNKADNTLVTAEITNNTSVMMASVAGDPNAIGYISLGSLNKTVKAVAIDGVAPSAGTVSDGTYPIARPFIAVTNDSLSLVAADFVAFIISDEGQAAVAEHGYVPVPSTGPYAGNRPAGKLVVAGSSSVAPLMEKLQEAYLLVNPSANAETQMSDSTTGVNSVIEGIADIGMSSRELKDAETSSGVRGTVIAMDGIVVIVSPDNQTASLTLDQVRKIYVRQITSWSELAN